MTNTRYDLTARAAANNPEIAGPAAKLIARSISHDEAVTVEYDAEIATALEALCEDSVDGAGLDGDVTEYWGTTEAGDEWRVHLTSASA